MRYGSSLTILHNPKCGTSRRTLELLRAQGLNPEIIEYVKEPPTDEDIQAILKWMQAGPRDILRRKEKTYSELGLDDARLTNEQLIRAMVDHPILIERPIVIYAGRAVVARPPERALEILGG